MVGKPDNTAFPGGLLPYLGHTFILRVMVGFRVGLENPNPYLTLTLTISLTLNPNPKP